MQIFKDGKLDEDIIVLKSSKLSNGEHIISVSSMSGKELKKGTIYTTNIKHLKNMSFKLDSKVSDNLYLLSRV